ncbi:MAG TPA: WG repeat-containing protein, partial [Niabella sp.]
YAAFLDEPVTGKSGQLHFEILEAPSSSSSYYQIQGFTYGDMQGVDQFLFLRSETGQLFHPGPDGKPVPFNRWLKASLQNCARYFRENRNAPNRFDVNAYLKGL